MSKLKAYGPVVLRIGISLVFLSFSYFQFKNPGMWVGVVPKWVSGMVGGNAALIVTINAWFELLFGLLLLAGFQVRVVSLILALNLLGITSTFGFVPTGVRDFGLSLATLSIFFTGMDIWSLDTRLAKKDQPVSNI